MQKMSGFELGFAVADLQALSGKRIAKVRETKNGIYLLKIGSGELLFEPGVRLHLYGKAEARPGRKMGHYNCLAASVEEALALARKTGIRTLIVNGMKAGSLRNAILGGTTRGTLVG